MVGPEPTPLEWAGFFVMLALGCYALGVGVLDRLPAWAGDGLRALLFRQIPLGLLALLRGLVWGLAYLGAAATWLLSFGRIPAFAELRGLAPDPDRGVHTVNRSLPTRGGYVTHDDEEVGDEGNENPVAGLGNEPANAIATGTNGGNGILPGNRLLRAQADIIARLYTSGTLYIPNGKGGFKRAGQVELIKLVTGLSPSGNKDSDYAKLKAELDPLLSREPLINGKPRGHAEAR